jgi:hypothetical protein
VRSRRFKFQQLLGHLLNRATIGFAFTVDINNEIGASAHQLSFQVGLVTARTIIRATFGGSFDATSFVLDSDHQLFMRQEVLEILPGSWKRIDMEIVTDNVPFNDGEQLSMRVRIFSSGGYEDHEFEFIVEKEPTKASNKL